MERYTPYVGGSKFQILDFEKERALCAGLGLCNLDIWIFVRSETSHKRATLLVSQMSLTNR